MNFLGSRYVKVNKLLLTITGLWPYCNTRLVRFQRLLSLLMILSGPIVQLASFVTREFNVDLFLEILTFTIIGITFVVEYTVFLLKIDNMAELFEKVDGAWKKITSEKESAIVLEYAEKALYIAMTLILLVIPSVSMIALSGLSSNILDILIPLNQSRPRSIPILVEYFVDQEKYFYAILAHFTSLTMLGSVSFIAVEATFMLFLLQACGFYKIVCQRIQSTTNEIKYQIPHELRDAMVRVRVVNVIKFYSTVIEFCDCLKSSFAMLYFTSLSLSIASLSLNLYAFYLTRSVAGGTGKLIFLTLVLIAHFGYIFYGNYVGQEVINQSSDIFTKTYNTAWYATPLPVRKLFLCLMQRSIRGYALTLGGIFVPCLEGFTTVTSMSVSYFMFLHSSR